MLGFTEKNEFIKVDGSDLSVDNIEDVVDLYGGNNAIITNDALVIYGKEGAFLNPQDDP